MSNILLIGSCEPFSGKSALVLGIAKKIINNNKKVMIIHTHYINYNKVYDGLCHY